MTWRGDIALGSTIDVKFTTRRFSSGAPFTLAGTPAVAAYIDNSTTEITAGITLSVDFDSRTGLNNVRVVASSGNGYAAGTNVALVITAGTVDGVSVVGEVVGAFSIENRSGLRPATAGRTLVVDAAGLADANMVKAGPTGSGTAQTAGDIYARIGAPAGASVSADVAAIKAVLPAALVSGRIDASVGAMAANVLTATAINADAITAAKIADGAIDSATFAAGAINAAAIGNDAITAAKVADGAIDANTFAAGAINAAAIAADAITAAKIADGAIDAATFAAGAIDAAAIAADAIGSSELAATAAAEIASAVRTELATELGRVDAAISTRLATAGYTAPLDAAGTRSAVGLASANLDTQIGTLATAATLSTVKSKTDNLPSDPADASDIATAFAALPSAAGIADAVWDEAISGHAGVGSTGEALANAGAAGTPPTAAAIADAVWDEARSGHTTNGTFGQGVASVQGNVTGSVASVTNDVGITQGGADKVWSSAARSLTTFGTLVADIATAVWGATTRVLTAGTNIVLAKGTGVTGFNDLSAAAVNAEADQALADAGVTTTVTGRIDATISSRLASSGYTAPDNTGISVAAAAAASAATNATTLVGRLTSPRAAALDNLDAAVTTRAAAGDAMTLTAPERGAIADKFLDRSLAGGADDTGSEARSVRNALRASRNKVDLVGGVTVYEEDDTTVAWTGTATTAPGDPLVAIDPK